MSQDGRSKKCAYIVKIHTFYYERKRTVHVFPMYRSSVTFNYITLNKWKFEFTDLKLVLQISYYLTNVLISRKKQSNMNFLWLNFGVGNDKLYTHWL